MTGALMQLVAYGAQDVYLTGNPQITFFKVVYRRHTNFAMGYSENTPNSSGDFGGTVNCVIDRAGDLLHNVWINATLPALAETATGVAGTGNDIDGGDGTTTARTHLCWVNRVGYRLLKEVEIEIGGQPIDSHNSTWMYVWSELSTPVEKKGEGGLNCLVGPHGTHAVDHNHAGGSVGGTTNNSLGVLANGSVAASQASSELTDTNNRSTNNKSGSNGKGLEIWVPLQFTFCRHPGLALPLIALQYHEVKLKITLETFENCLAHGIKNPRNFNNVDNLTLSPATAPGMKSSTTGETLGSSLTIWSNYIYLDTDERKKFAQTSHEYLIEQVQHQQSTVSGAQNHKVQLNFNHPVKELVWVGRRNDNVTNIDTRKFIADLGLGNTVNDTNITMKRSDAVNMGLISDADEKAKVWGSDDRGTGVDATKLNAQLPTILQGTLAAYAADADGTAAIPVSTGSKLDGCIFTDFCTDTLTLYTHPTARGISRGSSEAAGGPEGISQQADLAKGQTDLGVPIASGLSRAVNTAGTDANTTSNATKQAQGPFCFHGTSPMCGEARLVLNGTPRMATRSAAYFNSVQPFQHHSGAPSKGINCYSFALKPEEHQPSGTCNFSRIDNAQLEITTAAACVIDVYAMNYNVLRVQSGMGGLAYSS